MSQGQTSGGGQQSWEGRLQQFNQEAKQNMPDGAVTPAYKADRQKIIDMLNRALAGEWGSFLQYRHHYTMASDIHMAGIREIWDEQAGDELDHAKDFNERINQLGGVPANDPKEVARLNPTPFSAGHDIRSMLEDDLVGERATIEFYNEIVRTCGFDDNETRAMVEEILLDENEHANTLSNLLYQYDAATGKQIPDLHEETLQQPIQQRRAA